MKYILSIFLSLLLFYTSAGVSSTHNYFSKPAEDPKWPYLGYNSPRYLSLMAGIETIKSHYYLFGLGYSGAIYSTGRAPFGGVRVYYKQDMNNKSINAYEVDLCVASGLTFGLNYNLNRINSKNIPGFKPFIGISLFHFDFYYGYSFYKDNLDPDHYLVHNRFTLCVDIPTIRLSKRR